MSLTKRDLRGDLPAIGVNFIKALGPPFLDALLMKIPHVLHQLQKQMLFGWKMEGQISRADSQILTKRQRRGFGIPFLNDHFGAKLNDLQSGSAHLSLPCDRYHTLSF